MFSLLGYLDCLCLGLLFVVVVVGGFMSLLCWCLLGGGLVVIWFLTIYVCLFCLA